MRLQRHASSLFAWVTLLLTLFTPLSAEPQVDESSEWLGVVTERIQRAEYHFSERDDGALSAPNRAQGLRVFVTPAGLRVVPRVDLDDSWELRLELTGYGRGDSSTSVVTGAITADEGRVEIDRG